MSGKEGVREMFCAYCFMLKRMGVVSLPLANGFLMWYTNLGRMAAKCMSMTCNRDSRQEFSGCKGFSIPSISSSHMYNHTHTHTHTHTHIHTHTHTHTHIHTHTHTHQLHTAGLHCVQPREDRGPCEPQGLRRGANFTVTKEGKLHNINYDSL